MIVRFFLVSYNEARAFSEFDEKKHMDELTDSIVKLLESYVESLNSAQEIL